MAKPPCPIELAEWLVSQPSVNGDKNSENAMAERIALELTRLGLDAGFWRTGEGRRSVWALSLNNESPDVYVLLSHYDTVGLAEYASAGLAHIAFDSNALADRFAAGGFGADLGTDARSGDYAFGRGALDMKSGIAAQISALARKPSANVLFVSCPDEEAGSTGILSALGPMLELAAERGLRYRAVINSDYTAPCYPGDTSKYIYLGAIGKLLPSVLIAGITSHVGEPYQGIDACFLAAELVRDVSLNPDLCDRVGAEVSVPPLALRSRDLKTTYDTQTAFQSHVFINVMTYSQSPSRVLHKIRALAESAALRALERRRTSYESYSKGRKVAPPAELTPTVLLYEDLPAECRTEATRTATEVLPVGTDPREVSLTIVRQAARLAKVERPFMVVYLSPPYYPHVHTPEEGFRDEMQAFATANGFELRDFYPYISDVSYVGGAGDRAHLRAIAANIPQWEAPLLGYGLPESAMHGLGCPIVTVGPRGKEAHGLGERVEKASIQLASDMVARLLGCAVDLER